MSSVLNGTFPMAANDGFLGPTFDFSRTASSVSEDSPWLRLDMVSGQTITHLRVINKADIGKCRHLYDNPYIFGKISSRSFKKCMGCRINSLPFSRKTHLKMLFTGIKVLL